MPAAIAIPLITAGATAAGSIVAGKIQSGASKEAAKTATEGANKSAEIQAQSQREALAFQQAQAAEDARRFETTQRSNYDQWAARQGYQSTLGSMLGLPSRNIPAYQSSMPGGAPSGAVKGGGPVPNFDASKPIGPQVSAYFTSRGAPTTETPYWEQKWQEFGKNDPAYFAQRVAQADILGGGGGAPSVAAPTRNYSPAYIGPASSLIPPQPTYTSRTLTPALRLPGVY